MMFKNDEFKLWIEEKGMTLEEVWNLSKEERTSILKEFMEAKKDIKPWTFSTDELVEFINELG